MIDLLTPVQISSALPPAPRENTNPWHQPASNVAWIMVILLVVCLILSLKKRVGPVVPLRIYLSITIVFFMFMQSNYVQSAWFDLNATVLSIGATTIGYLVLFMTKRVQPVPIEELLRDPET